MALPTIEYRILLTDVGIYNLHPSVLIMISIIYYTLHQLTDLISVYQNTEPFWWQTHHFLLIKGIYSKVRKYLENDLCGQTFPAGIEPTTSA